MGIVTDKITSVDNSCQINVNQMIKYEDGLIKTIQGDILSSVIDELEIVSLTGDNEVNISGEEFASSIQSNGFFIFYQEAPEPNWNAHLMEVTCQLGESLPNLRIETANLTIEVQPEYSANNVHVFPVGTINSDFIKISLVDDAAQAVNIQKIKFDLWTI